MCLYKDVYVNIYNRWHLGMALPLLLLLGLPGKRRVLGCPAVLEWICSSQTKSIMSCSNDKNNTIM